MPPTNKFPPVFKLPPMLREPARPAPPATNNAPVKVDVESDESVIYVWPAMAVCSVPPTNKLPIVLRSPPSVIFPSIAAPPATNNAPLVNESEKSVFVITV